MKYLSLVLKLPVYLTTVCSAVIVLFLLVGSCVIFGSMAQITHSIISSLLNLLHRLLVLRFVCSLY